ncbi:GNAT family N-acetyltransferase [Chryseobacterium indologenes]|uniref:GNAT family N-acetyltransferase n=1 Tax=Chryseobacterium indologenes TaxID=253 RepID=UPI00102401E1|nr:GNAT family N-acetyltransferase [Chryseobacterium indologenes]TLX26095.1 GNAT family N-acetyltransferase [Chryseobacterium indologenes]VFA43672.1 putative acetyltransferase [Chryseobacterium indologenes]
MIQLRFFTKGDLSELNYALDENQSRFTANVEQALRNLELREDHKGFAVTITEDEKPVGFFVLDFGEDKFELTDNESSVLVRSLSVNPEMQGKGIGKAAMLKVDGFVRDNFRNCNEIVLAVNQKNEAAYHIYLSVGYVDEGKTRIGRSGPQYLMYKKL